MGALQFYHLSLLPDEAAASEGEFHGETCQGEEGEGIRRLDPFLIQQSVSEGPSFYIPVIGGFSASLPLSCFIDPFIKDVSEGGVLRW